MGAKEIIVYIQSVKTFIVERCKVHVLQKYTQREHGSNNKLQKKKKSLCTLG